MFIPMTKRTQGNQPLFEFINFTVTYLTGSRINGHADHFCQDYTTTPLLQ
jgi:hypothetical protein